MKFIITRDQLLTPLLQIVNVIEKKQTMPILANVLLKFENSQLILTGTDLEIQIIAKINLDPAQAGATTVPGRKLLDICRSFSKNVDIKFVLQENKLKISSGRSRFSLNTLNAEDYPEFISDSFEHSVVMQSGQLKNALQKTAFCMGLQDVRYYLNGLMLNVFNNTIKFVASDGHRLSIYEDTIEQETGTEARFIIPRKGVIELIRLLDDSEDSVTLEYSLNNIQVHYKNLVFSAKLIDSKYPDFGKVFLQDFNIPIHFPKQQLKESLTRIAILANEKSKGVNLFFNEGCLKISTHNPEQEEADEEVIIDYHNEPLSIAFNAQYLLDAINNVSSETLVFTSARNGSCCFIEEPDQHLYRFIIMSMKI